MRSEPVTAIVMAGGRGTRLAPYTTVLPKPLMPIDDRPIIDVVLRQIAAAGVTRAAISVGHLGALIEAWVREHDDYGLELEFLYEHEPLGTAGALGLLRADEGTVLALNGDILTTLRFDELLEAHRRNGAIATVAANARSVDVEYGVLELESRDGVEDLIGLSEKPTLRFTVSMGIYAFERRVLDYVERGRRLDFPDLLRRLLDEGQRVCGHRHEGYWRDIGNADDYAAAVKDFSEERGRFLPG